MPWTTYETPYNFGNTTGAFVTSQKAQFPCFIGVIITPRPEFNIQSAQVISQDELAFISNNQIRYMYDILYARLADVTYIDEMSNSRSSLFIRVQINFRRIIISSPFMENVFQYFTTLTIIDDKGIWYRMCLPCRKSMYGVNVLETEKAILAISSHAKFSFLLDQPSHLSLVSKQLVGYFNMKESCRAYKIGPFQLIREEGYQGRAILFFTLACLGNFTCGEANPSWERTDWKIDEEESKTYK